MIIFSFHLIYTFRREILFYDENLELQDDSLRTVLLPIAYYNESFIDLCCRVVKLNLEICT